MGRTRHTADTLEHIIDIARIQSEVITHIHCLREALDELSSEQTEVSLQAVSEELSIALAPLDVHLRAAELLVEEGDRV